MRSNTHCVLVIDDDSNIRTLIKLLLEHQGHRVFLALDGDTGLKLAAQQRPDIILLDVAMPRRSGMDVYKDLQSNQSTADIPILVFSAALTQNDVQMWQKLPNVAEVISKPFDIY